MFRRAVIKLTLQYTALFLGTAWLLSLGVYVYMERTFGGDYILQITSHYQTGNNHGENIDRVAGANDAVETGLSKLRTGLLLLDGALIIIVPAASYALANSTLKPIKRSYQRQQEFIDDASHELRTPLTVLTAELELAQREPSDPKQLQASLATSLGEARHISSLIDQLLMLAQGRDESLQSSFERIDMRQIIELAMIHGATFGAERSVTLTANITSPVRVKGSKPLLVQAVGNLINNAIKASAPGQAVKVKLVQRHHCEVIIADAGQGMTDTALARATDRFWQQNPSRDSSGHGLGLAIVNQVALLHHGTLQLGHNHPKGIIATLRLPLDRHSS